MASQWVGRPTLSLLRGRVKNKALKTELTFSRSYQRLCCRRGKNLLLMTPSACLLPDLCFNWELLFLLHGVIQPSPQGIAPLFLCWLCLKGMTEMVIQRY